MQYTTRALQQILNNQDTKVPTRDVVLYIFNLLGRPCLMAADLLLSAREYIISVHL